MGEALRRDAQTRRRGRRARALLLTVLALAAPTARAQEITRLSGGRFTVGAAAPDLPLARTLLAQALARDTFPGLPRPRDPVAIMIAPDARRFREWTGPGAPEWGAAIAIPAERRIVMQGSSAGSDAGDPVNVLRHELAHLALYETMGDLPPRWFDEGYASWCAREWARDEALAASVGLVIGGVPPLDSLDEGFAGGAVRAGTAYALSYRAVADLAALDSVRGLALFLERWRATGSMDRAMRDAFGLTRASFEESWRRRTLRRYGALAVLANATVLFALLGLFLIPVYAARRRRDRRRLEAMRAAEAAVERKARESAIAMLLASAPGEPPPPP
jgi:hypothetical protein